MSGGSNIGFAVAEPACGLDAEVVIASIRAATVETAVERPTGATGQIVGVRDEAGVIAFLQRFGNFNDLAMMAGDCGGAKFAPTRDADLDQARGLQQ